MNEAFIDLIGIKTDSLIEDFEKTFLESSLLKDKKDAIIKSIKDCFEHRKITENNTTWILNNLFSNLDIQYKSTSIVRKKDEAYEEYIMRKWGEEYGCVILLFQKTIREIAVILIRNRKMSEEES
jgi:hypothetical protein